MRHSLSGFLSRIITGNRITLSVVGGAIFLYLARPATWTILSGLPLVLIGEATRTWASGFIKKDRELAKDGPYALTRNPLYLGNFMIGIGFSIMANNLILLALFIVVFYLIYSVTIHREERRLIDKFGETFLTYKSSVPVFFPLRLLPPNLDASFNWRLALSHREHHTWLGIAGCIIIFILKLSYFHFK